MEDVFAEPVHDLLHALRLQSRTAAELLAGDALDELALVQGEGLVFGAEVEGFPVVQHGQSGDQLVDELRLPVAGPSGDDEQPSGLEGAEAVEVGQSRLGAACQAVFEEGPQVFAQVGRGHHVFQRQLGGLVEAVQQAVASVAQQFFVGVLAVGAEGDDAAAFLAKAAYQLVAHLQAVGIGVGGQVDGLHGVEVALHEAVQPGGVGVSAGGHGDDGRAAHFVQGQGVNLAFDDVAAVRPLQRVEVVGDEFGAFHHFEGFLQGAELGVHQSSVLEVVEADAEFGVLGRAALPEGGHGFVLSGHLELAQGLGADATLAYQVVGDGGGQVEVGLDEAGAYVAPGGRLGFVLALLAVEAPLALAFFVGVGYAEIGFAVEAVAPSGVQVDGERLVLGVGAGVFAFGAGGPYLAAGAAAGVDAGLTEISHVFCVF